MDKIKSKKTPENNVNLKKGISLIVLVITIIVIIILAAAVILTLTNNNPIENAKQAAFINDIVNFQDELDMYKINEYAKNLGGFDPTSLNANSTNTTLLYTYIPSLEGKTKYENEIAVVAGKLRYIGTDAKKIAWATSVNIETGEALVVVGTNEPVLSVGMTAIKWNETTSQWDEVTNPTTDTSWYSYTNTNKQWANARTSDGSMWVWIPRYEYQIPIPHSSTAQTIAVNFISGTGTTASSGYTIHPAFTFGTTQLSGIWVAKFEASGTTSAINVVPEVSSLKYVSINDIFTACINMATNTAKYGWSTTNLDTHLMKNVEWGACAYLTQSTYGKNSEVWINPDSDYTTGRAGTSVNASSTTSTYPYSNATYGVKASTTGNIYGIYDMKGCSWEYVAGYVENGNESLTTYGNSLYTAGSQYKDVYTSSGDTEVGNYAANSGKKGDAVYETSTSSDSPYINSWFTDYSYMPFSNSPFFLRGGDCKTGIYAGVFEFNNYEGCAGSVLGFRPVVALGSGL